MKTCEISVHMHGAGQDAVPPHYTSNGSVNWPHPVRQMCTPYTVRQPHCSCTYTRLKETPAAHVHKEMHTRLSRSSASEHQALERTEIYQQENE